MNESSKAFRQEWVPRLFSRMRAIYGNKTTVMWAESDPDEVQQVWGDALFCFDGDDVRMALGAMVHAYKDFPPTLPQFVDLCREARKQRGYTLPRLPARVRLDEIDPEVLARIHEFTRMDRKRDPRDWARQILAGVQDGSYTNRLGIQYAEEALGLRPEANRVRS